MFEWRNKTEEQIADNIVARHARLKAIRSPLEPVHDLVTKLFLPRTWDMQKSIKGGTEQYGVAIYNPISSEARRKFAAGFVSQTATKRDESETSWINFIAHKRILMKNDRVKKYMQEAAEQIRSGFDKSTFYRETAFQAQIADASVLWGVMTIDEDIVADRLVFQRQDPRDHWFSCNVFDDVDVDHFAKTYTAEQLVDRFDNTKLHPDIINQAKGEGGSNPYQEYQCIQAIYDNGSRVTGSVHNHDNPFIQFVVLLNPGKDTKKHVLIEIQGKNWRPSVLRIGERLSSGYPLTMAMDALTSATYGNTIAKHGLIGSHRMIQPPKLIHENLRDQIQRHRLAPDSNTYTTTADEKIEYLAQKIDTRYAEEVLNRENGFVEDRFFIPFFEQITRIQASGGSPPTATQIRAAIGERIGQLTSVIESSEDASLEPSVNAMWAYETSHGSRVDSRYGRMPEPPQELIDEAVGGEIKVLNKWNGELAQLKRTVRVNQGAVEALAIIKEMKQVFPSALVIVKSKQLLEKMLTNRIGQDTIHNDYEVAQIEQQLAQLEKEERQMENAERMSKVIPSLTKDAVNPESPAALAAAS
jgi:hypothetical protein